jgi:hypothetical protein
MQIYEPNFICRNFAVVDFASLIGRTALTSRWNLPTTSSLVSSLLLNFIFLESFDEFDLLLSILNLLRPSLSSPNRRIFAQKFSFPNFLFDIFDPSKMRETFLDPSIRPSSIHQSARNFSWPVISRFFFANFWPRARLIVFERPLTFIFRPNFAQIRPRTLSSFADFRLSTFIFDFYLYTSNFVDSSFLERMRRSGLGLVKPDKTAFGFLNRALGRTSNVFRRLGAYCRYRVPVPTRGIL